MRRPLCQVPLRLRVVEQVGLAVLADDQRVPARDARVVDLDVGAEAAPSRVTVPMIGTSLSSAAR